MDREVEPAPGAHQEDELREAISRVRISSTEVLSTRAVHAALQQESAWRELTLSELKRISSKMAKQAAAGAVPVQPAGSLVADAAPSSSMFGISLGAHGSAWPGGVPAELATVPISEVKCCAACGKSDVPLKTCERCVHDGLTGLRICSQQCWEAVWPQHKMQHKRLRMVRSAEAIAGRTSVPADYYEEKLQLAREGGNEYEVQIATARNFEQRRNYKKAEKALRRAIALEPANPNSFFQLARIHGSQANFRAAAQTYDDCIQRCAPTSLMFAGALALHFGLFAQSRRPPKPQEGDGVYRTPPSFDDCLINREFGDLGPPPKWWNRPGLMALSAVALDTLERVEQGAFPSPEGRGAAASASQHIAVLKMRANVLSAFPQTATFTLNEKVLGPAPIRCENL